MSTLDNIIEERVLQAAKLLILENSNVRHVARRIGCSKSTVHKDLSERLKDIDYKLYLEVQKIFEINKQEKHLRGGNSTKNKYLGRQ
ncbi:MAG: sporulation transcriptional regulator SpoIIID [Bacilli bacterium]|nr:sporulation transcriptional regulator SpoIIID [Bacilli bacterium]